MKDIVAKLESLLRLRTIPFGMKLYETVAEMEAIPKIRRPKGSKHTLDQIVGAGRAPGLDGGHHGGGPGRRPVPLGGGPGRAGRASGTRAST